MKKKIKVEQEIDLATAECQVFVRYWEDSEVNGKRDSDNSPSMPCVQSVKHFYYGRPALAWCPIINLDNGQITNWKQGVKAYIHYKSVDENVVIIKDREGRVVKEYEGYVPNFLCPIGGGYGDYVIMEIDENGLIQNFKANFDDIFEEDDE